MQSALTLPPSKTALLLVDFQEDQRGKYLKNAPHFLEALQNAQSLLTTCRAGGIAVFHAAYRRDFNVRPPRPFEPRTSDGKAGFSDKTDPLTAICLEVAPLPGEAVITKNDASAFEEGSLERRLRDRGIEWLVVAGVWTEACIAATVRDAMAAGFRVLIVKDACTSGTAAMHQTAVLNLANRLYGGAVADTARVKNLLAGNVASVWRTDEAVPILFDYANAEDHYKNL